MSRVRHIVLLAALGAGAVGCRSVGPDEVQLPEKLDPRLADNARACVKRLNRDRERAQNAMLTSDLMVLLGATTGAIGSLLAAFLSKPASRRASAVVGAVGALTTASTKTLDDAAEILTRRARAERHWVVGFKVLTQTALATEGPQLATQSRVMELTGESARAALAISSEQRNRALLYVLDRFIDCRADLPPETFEELPSSGLFAVGEKPSSLASERGAELSADKAQALLVYVEPASDGGTPPELPAVDGGTQPPEPEPTVDGGRASP